MNNQEAKFTLEAFRPAGQDASDATFGEALQRAKDDPELGAWLARSRAHDAAIAAKLREIVPPAELRAAILAGARASTTTQPWWRRPSTWAMAAAVVALFSVLAVVRRGHAVDARTAALAEFALHDLHVPGHRGHDTATDGLQTWLVTGSKLTSGQPMDFAELKAHGCRTLSFAGHELAEVCFVRDGVVFHLYALPREAMPELPARVVPALVERVSQAAAVWSDDRFHYVLATSASAEYLKRLL